MKIRQFVQEPVGPIRNRGIVVGSVIYSPFEESTVEHQIADSQIVDSPSFTIPITLEDVRSAKRPIMSSISKSGLLWYRLYNSTGIDIKTDGDGVLVPRSRNLQVDLVQRKLGSDSRWSSWKIIQRIRVSDDGWIKFSRLKLSKGTYEFDVKGVGFSLGSKVIGAKITSSTGR